MYESSMVPLALCSGTSKSASFSNATWRGRRSSEPEWTTSKFDKTTSASKVTLQLETYVRAAYEMASTTGSGYSKKTDIPRDDWHEAKGANRSLGVHRRRA